MGLSYPEKYGGQGLPPSLATIQADMMCTANWAWTMYPGLSRGAINTIMNHGDEYISKKYLEKLISGEWTGTMCLTEPHCGSDLAQVKTKAEPFIDEHGNQKYKITGTKIFISCGEHDMAENIIHCVLARLPGAPEGTKGISLFSVPKRYISEDFNGDDTTLGDINALSIGRIEDKMGCHGSSTCEVNFDGAVGELIGTENKGLNHMFTFINTSRVGVAIQGMAAAELSFQQGLPYCKDRLAMRSVSGKKNPDGPADPIIVHPAVRKLLLFQKCIAEGARSMIVECCVVNDLMVDANLQGDEKEAKNQDSRLGFLTPILKGFLTEVGLEAANNGVQVFGGHGYIKSNKQEQILRDVRIAPLWEGTTQIQALDLLGRKIMLGKLKPLNDHCSELRSFAFKQFLSPESSEGNIRSHAGQLLKYIIKWQMNTAKIATKAVKNRDIIASASQDYIMYSGYVQMAYHWLQMEVAAAKSLEKGTGNASDDFYKAKLLTSKYYFDDILPRADLHAKVMLNPSENSLGMHEDLFMVDN